MQTFTFGYSELVTFAVVLSVCLLATQYLFGFYRPTQYGIGGLGRQYVQRWDFSPGDLGGFGYGRLLLISVLSLFLELLVIRWISSEIRIFAYFKNFVLTACFLGFGLGCYFSRRRINLLAFLAPFTLLVLLMKLPWTPLRNVFVAIPLIMLADDTVMRDRRLDHGLVRCNECLMIERSPVAVNFFGTWSIAGTPYISRTFTQGEEASVGSEASRWSYLCSIAFVFLSALAP